MRACVCALTLAATSAAAAPLRFQAGDVTARADDETSSATTPGTTALWVELSSVASVDRHVRVSFHSTHGRGQAERRVVLAGRETRVVSLPVVNGMFPGTISVAVDETGRTGTQFVRVRAQEDDPVLVLGTKAQLDRFAAERWTPFASFYERRQMPDTLAGYSGDRAVLLLDRSAADLGPAQRKAVEEYALTGGQVYFGLDAAAGAPSLDTWRATPGTRGSPEEPLGFGHVYVCTPGSDCLTPLKASPATDVRILQSGDVVVPPGPSRPKSMLGTVGRNHAGAFFAIVLIFAIVIGPGTLLYSRRHGRHTMLVTIPIIAFTTCGGIASYGIAADGLFTVHTAASGLAILDSEHHRAAVVAVSAYFAGLGPGRVRYGPDVTDLFLDREGDRLSIDWTDGETLSGDFIPSREYKERAAVAVQPSHARLVLLDGDSVENDLGGAIGSGYVREGNRRWELLPMEPGERRPLGPLASGETPDFGEIARFADRFGTGWTESLIASLQEGDFLVVMKGSADEDDRAPAPPFVPAGDLKLTWHPSQVVVRGRLSR